MPFDFMKNFMMFENDERFARICESIEETIREADSSDEKISDMELMQALDFVGFSLFRDDWEEFKKMELHRDLGTCDPSKNRGKGFIH
ncbi:MAG: hypothetical protein ACE5E9_07165 [Nitrospinaceae bacterium]